MLKAFQVHEHDSPDQMLLVFVNGEHDKPNHCSYGPTAAKVMALNAGLYEFDYLRLRAVRRPEFDCWAISEVPYVAETNDDLAKGAPPFYRDAP